MLMEWEKNVHTYRQRTEVAHLMGVDHFVMIRISIIYIHICVFYLISVG